MSESRRNFIAHRPTDVVRKRSSAYGNPVRTHAVSGVSVASKLPPWESWKSRGFSPDAAYRAWGCGGSLTKSAKGAEGEDKDKKLQPRTTRTARTVLKDGSEEVSE